MMFRRSILVGCVVIVGLAAACAPPATTQVTPRINVALAGGCPAGGGPVVPPTEITADGRVSSLRAPTNYEPGVAYPLLVSLHPFTIGPGAWDAISLLGQAAADRGYWTLIPEGSAPGPRWAVPGGLDYGVDDIGWVDHLLHETANTVCVAADRVFAAGYSAGAAMAVGLSCELPWRFRAVMAVAGANLTLTCPMSGPTAALILHGTGDPIAPPTGQTLEFLPPLGLPVTDVVASFAARNGCVGEPTTSAASVSVTVSRYSCAGHATEYWSVLGGGHTWPGSPINLDFVTGPTDQSISATTIALDFFDQS